MIRNCDGTDDGLIMHINIDGEAEVDPGFSVEVVNCACGSSIDDEARDLTWPHVLLNPAVSGRLINDLPDVLGYF